MQSMISLLARTHETGYTGCQLCLLRFARPGQLTSTRKSLAEDDHVRLDTVPLVAKPGMSACVLEPMSVVASSHLSCPAESGLDLVADQENVVLLADFGTFGEVSVVGHVDTAKISMTIIRGGPRT